MQNILKPLIFITALLFASNVFAKQLTDNMVNDLIKKMDVAIETNNTDLVASTLSDDIEITINFENQGKKQVAQLTKQQYVSSLGQGWQVFENYSYKRSNLVIKLKDNKATLTMDVLEKITLQGQEIVTATNEKSVIELVGDKPLFTEIFANAVTQ